MGLLKASQRRLSEHDFITARRKVPGFVKKTPIRECHLQTLRARIWCPPRAAATSWSVMLVDLFRCFQTTGSSRE